MRRLQALLLIGLVLVCQPAVLEAQGVQWSERRTAYFSVLYPMGEDVTAGFYAQFADSIYDEVSALWNYRPVTPIVLRVYPTMELYYQANPLAAQLPGVVAHAHTGRREISVAIPQTAGQTEEEIKNNVRHELSHIIAADLSGGRLTTPWQEGIAQYAEHPTAQLDLKMGLLRDTISQNRILSWNDLNTNNATYADPQVGYPETFTIVAFLIQRNGMDHFRAFTEMMRTSDYRSALQAVYGASADTLEGEWRAQLEPFVDGGYRNLASGPSGRVTFDLAPVEQQVAEGSYAEAASALRSMIPGLRTAGDGAQLLQAQSLLARAEAGDNAVKMADNARDALLHGDYRTANEASAMGRDQFEALGMTKQAEILADYNNLANRGLEAEVQLSTAGDRMRLLRLGEARVLLMSAYNTFSELGDQSHADQAQASLALIERGEQLAAGGCVLGGALLLLFSMTRKFKERQQALPFG